MAQLLPSDIDDIVNSLYVDARENTWTDISLPNQFYVFAPRFSGENRGQWAPQKEKSGATCQWTLQVANQANFRYTNMFSQDRTGIANQLKNATAKWSIWTTNWSYDVLEEVFAQGARAIVNELQAREHGMWNQMFDVLENHFFFTPSTDSVDPMPMLGLRHWLQRNATEGLNGGDPSGFSAGCGGILGATYPNWKNYTFTYSAVTENDLIQKMRRAVALTEFRPAHKFPNSTPEMPQWELLTTFRLLNQMETFQISRNDNIKDLSGTGDAMLFKGVPVAWVPVLENSSNFAYDSTDPIYGLNWGTWEFYVNAANRIRRTKKASPTAHNVQDVHYDGMHQLVCNNRRNNFIAYRV